MNSKLTINIEGMQVEGLSPLAVLKSFYALKKELEGKGCKVTITVDGQELGRAGEPDQDDTDPDEPISPVWSES